MMSFLGRMTSEHDAGSGFDLVAEPLPNRPLQRTVATVALGAPSRDRR
jgi:hypothetical protein